MFAACLVGAAATAEGQASLSIDGTATYRERMALPSDAVFEARLEDVSRADAGSRVIGSARIERPGNPPFHFTINYDSGQILPAHVYSVRARITQGGRLLFTTDQQYQVLTQGHGSDITMMVLRRVGGTTATAPNMTAIPLRETYWKLVQLEDQPVTATDQQQEANLVFHTEGSRVAGSSGCNRLTGAYAVDGQTLRFNGIASTRMACMRGMEMEASFLAALEKVRTWKINGQQLDLADSNGRLLARFMAQTTK
jgi:putative lipoprotein